MVCIYQMLITEHGYLDLNIDPRRSIAWYTKAAEQGDPDAELGLSGWYLTGAHLLLQKSESDAYLWARKAADKGLAKAEFAVGYFSENGIGTKPDLHEAKKWYRRAAEQGNKRAIKRLQELQDVIGEVTGYNNKSSMIINRKRIRNTNIECSIM